MAEVGARLIVDTNVWLEQLLDQDRAHEVAKFFGRVHDRELAISEFTLYSIGHILVAREQPADLRSFLTDVLIDGHVSRVRLSNHELDALPTLVEEFSLDFDDAYQYLAATSRELSLVSFDTDFDRTDLDRLEPQEIGG